MFDVVLQYCKISALEMSLCILVAKMSQGAWGEQREKCDLQGVGNFVEVWNR